MSGASVPGGFAQLSFEYDCEHLWKAFRSARLTGDLTSIDVTVSADEFVLSTAKQNARSRSSLQIKWHSSAPEQPLTFTTNRRLFQILQESSADRATVKIQPPVKGDDTSQSREWIWSFVFKEERATSSKEIEWPFVRSKHQPFQPLAAEGRSIAVSRLLDAARMLHGFFGGERDEIRQSIQIGNAAALAQARTKARLVRDASLDTPVFCCSSSHAKDISAALDSFREVTFHAGNDWVAFTDRSSALYLSGKQNPSEIDESKLPKLDARVRLSTTDLDEAISKISIQASGRRNIIRIEMSRANGGALRLSCAVPSDEPLGGRAVVTLPLPPQEENHLQDVAIQLRLDDLGRLIAIRRAEHVVLAFDANAICATQDLDGVICKSWIAAARGRP